MGCPCRTHINTHLGPMWVLYFLLAGTRLCSYIPDTKNVVISEYYTIKTSNSRQGVLKMVSEFGPPGIIGLGLPTSTILLEIFLGDRPDNFFFFFLSFFPNTYQYNQIHTVE